MLEEFGDYVVLHIHGGLKVNRTIQKIVAHFLAKRVEAPVKGHQDPYRVVFRSKHISGNLVMEVIKDILEGDYREKLVEAIESSTLFKRRLVHVARKMDVIRSDASLSEININQLAETLKGTVVYEETLNYTLFHDFELERSRELLEKIVNGEIKLLRWISPTDEPSPLARLTVERFRFEGEVSTVEGMRRVVLMAVRSRLLNEPWLMVCTDCFEHYGSILVKELPIKPKCPVCGSDKIGLTKYSLEEALGLIARKGKPINKKERRIIAELRRNSVLISKYGRAAALVLSARGLTLKEVTEILKKEPHESMKLIELIVEAEKKALQRRFR